MSNNNNNLCTYGCCEGNEKLTPAALYNSPGLSALHFRVGTHHGFKESMLTALTQWRATRQLTTRDDDDLAIATLDAWATVLDVVGFYQERIINEGFLRTATERLSVVGLAEHINYKLKPGVAASTWLAFSMNEAVGAPAKAMVPQGTKVQSIPEQDQLPQIFETIEEIEARVEWNNLKLLTKEKKIPQYGDEEIFLRGINTGLQPGDGILMIGKERKDDSTNENWDFRRVKEIITDNDRGFTKVTWDKGLGKTTRFRKVLPAALDFRIYAMKQKASLFGYNAPDFRVISGSVKSQFLTPGILARYYTGISFDTLTLERSENKIDNVWSSGGPGGGVPANGFSAIWSGSLLSPVSGEVTFYTLSDDGVRLYVNNKLIINNWTNHADTEDSATINLEAGQLYSFLLEYYEDTGSARIQLSWSGPELSKDIIPAKNYFRTSDTGDWPGFTISAISGEEDTIHLDGINSKIIKGNWLIVSKSDYEEVYEIDDVSESAKKDFTLASKTTRVKLKGENLKTKFDTHIRDAVIFAQSEAIELAEKPITASPSGNVIQLEMVLPDLPADKKIIVSGRLSRLMISPSAQKLVMTSEDKVEREISPGDSLVIMRIPELNGTTLFTLKDNAGFVGTISLTRQQWQPTDALPLDEVISEIHTIKDIVVENYSTTLTLENNLTNYYDRSSVIVYANIAKATHGETKEETLGSGDGSQVFQKFELKQKPLTYVSAANAKGIETTLEVRVNDILWKEVTSFYGVSPKARAYTVNIDDDGKVTIQFGDGITGARLPTGNENVKAKYRAGIGTDGMLNSSSLTMLMTPQLGVNKVDNPLPTSGAENKETFDSAKRNVPFTVLTLDRIVSLKDFEDFAGAFAGISKSRADLIWNGEQQAVFITIASADTAVVDKESDLYINLLGAIKAAGKFYRIIYLGNYEEILFSVDARVKIDPTYLFENVQAAIVAKLNETFSFDARDFGQDVTPAEVITAIQQAAGVVYVDLELLDGQNPLAQDHYRIPSEIARRSGESLLPAQLLIIDSSNVSISQILT